MSKQAVSWMDRVVDAPAARTQARRAEHDVVVENGLWVPMRDGTLLAATLWRPSGSGRYPALIERGPHRLVDRTGPAGQYYAARGYAVLGVSVRGTGGSQGAFDPATFGSPAGDGYDTIEWAAAQSWCNGRIGLLCGSISGYTSYQAATEAPPHLRALFVREGPGFGGFAGMGGAFPLLTYQSAAMSWLQHRLEHLDPETRLRAEERLAQFGRELRAAGSTTVSGPEHPELVAATLPVTPSLMHLPLGANPLFAGVADEYAGWVSQAAYPTQSNAKGLTSLAAGIRGPICHLGGWFDGIVLSTLEAYASIAPGVHQRLVVGPWVHGPKNTAETRVGALELGPQAAVDLMAFRGRWYDHYLSERDTGLENDPKVWIYLIGTDCWIGAESWPPEGVVSEPWYLGSGAVAGAGGLGAELPPSAEAGDAYVYDPHEPVPSLAGGGPFGMGMDQRPLEHRLLCYTSAPLESPIALVGPLKAVLHAASSAPDTDWVVRLSWVRPDGSAIILSGGILRARYRDSLWEPKPLAPGEPARFEVAMMPLSVAIPAGDRLRLSVTSSDYPAYDRNLNTGEPIDRSQEMCVATNTVYHDRLRPSHVVLPVWR